MDCRGSPMHLQNVPRNVRQVTRNRMLSIRASFRRKLRAAQITMKAQIYK